MTLRCLFGHDWRRVGPDHPCHAWGCFDVYKGCLRSVKVCVRCRKWVAFGWHGKMTVLPGICEEQVRRMLP